MDLDQELWSRHATEQEEYVRWRLSPLPGERSYVVALLMYERLVAVAEEVDRQLVETEERIPPAELGAVLDKLWNRLPDGPPDPTLDEATAGWRLVEQPGTVEEALVTAPAELNRVRISDGDAALALTLWMVSVMTSAADFALLPVELAAQRTDLAEIRDAQLDIPAMRARARKIGRVLTELGMC